MRACVHVCVCVMYCVHTCGCDAERKALVGLYCVHTGACVWVCVVKGAEKCVSGFSVWGWGDVPQGVLFGDFRGISVRFSSMSYVL